MSFFDDDNELVCPVCKNTDFEEDEDGGLVCKVCGSRHQVHCS